MILNERSAFHDSRIMEKLWGKIISALELLGNIFFKLLTIIVEKLLLWLIFKIFVFSFHLQQN